MKCKKCGNEANYNRRYCRECGSYIGKNCTRCNFTNDENDKYCGGCGVSVTQMNIQEPLIISKDESDRIAKYFSQYDEEVLNSVINAAEKLKTENNDKISSTSFQQEDIDRLFS